MHFGQIFPNFSEFCKMRRIRLPPIFLFRRIFKHCCGLRAHRWQKEDRRIELGCQDQNTGTEENLTRSCPAHGKNTRQARRTHTGEKICSGRVQTRGGQKRAQQTSQNKYSLPGFRRMKGKNQTKNANRARFDPNKRWRTPW
jgi:hypothetical protein